MENCSISGVRTEGNSFGNRREIKGFSELSEAQVIAPFSSMHDHSAMPMLFQVGSEVVAANLRAGIRATESTQTLRRTQSLADIDIRRERNFDLA